MESHLKYYQDAYLIKSDAIITDIREEKNGKWLATDQTLFYPGGGGQLIDHGTINNINVQDVTKEENIVWHLLNDFSGIIGDSIQMEIDWQRRFYMMQQHSGQHLLSYVLQTHNLPTVSVHLGEEYTMIEVDGEVKDDTHLKQIENQANALIQAHIAFKIHWTDRESIKDFPLRRPAGNWEKLRIIEIEGKDFAACGGTHVANSAEIGLVKCIGMEKIRGHARLKFVIGKAAYDLFNLYHDTTSELKQLLQADLSQLIERSTQVTEELNTIKRERDIYCTAWLNGQAEILNNTNKDLVIFYRIEEENPKNAEELAKQLVNNYKRAAFICSANRFYFIRPKKLDINVSDFLRTYGNELKLRGGGPPDFVQGILQENNDSQIQEKLKKF